MHRPSSEERMAQARECVESGLTVRAWCEANGVPAGTMYRWVARLRDEEVSEGAPTFVEVAPAPRPAPAGLPIVVRVGAAEVLVPAGADGRDVACVLGAAASL